MKERNQIFRTQLRDSHARTTSGGLLKTKDYFTVLAIQIHFGGK